MKISKATISDLNSLNNLNINNNIDYSKKSLKSDIENHIIFIMKIDNTIIGYISILLSDFADINYILIDKNYRKRGFASSLLNHLEKYLKNKNIYEIFLEVKVTNTNAISLYIKHNFKIINTRKNYYNDNTDAYVLKKYILK